MSGTGGRRRLIHGDAADVLCAGPCAGPEFKRLARGPDRPAAAPIATRPRRRDTLAVAAVLLLAFLIYAPSLGHDFCPVDDAYFVLENPLVQGGLTGPGIRAAWTTVHASYWAPLLWLSFMADQEISGGAPWSFHLTNGLLFAASAGLLFGLVRRWTGRTGVALAAALLWALHPARVESVAWITARKDVLSGLFFLAALWFYTVGRESGDPVATGREPPGEAIPGRGRPGSTYSLPPVIYILLSWICMLLGGMAKQVVIVLPAALILLDVWPLGRTEWGRIWKDVWKLAAEKWAFWLLAIGLAVVPIWTHVEEQALLNVPLARRLAMIPIHYLFYLQKIVWPAALAPLQEDLMFSGWKLAVGLGLPGGLTLAAWGLRRRAPWALWGWLWFAGLLFPLSGVVWAGTERIAVRFLYLPQIGLTLAVVLGAAAWCGRRPERLLAVRLGLAAILLASTFATLRTLAHWRDKDTFGLWLLECHPGQGAACAIGGDVHLAWGQLGKAQTAYEQGVTLGDRSCFLRLGLVWNSLGQTERTLAAWGSFEQQSGRRLTDFAPWERAVERSLAWGVRGEALRAQGQLEAARSALREAVRWEPDDDAWILVEYVRASADAGRLEEAAGAAARLSAAAGRPVREWRDLLPFYAQTWKGGARGRAFAYFAEYAERFPADAVNLNYMAWLLATAAPDGLEHARKEEWTRAALRWVELAMQADASPPPGVWETLGAARALAGDSRGAVAAAEKARELARAAGDEAAEAKYDRQILAYRMGLTWRE